MKEFELAEDQLSILIDALQMELTQPFVLWLQGEMGAGKTCFVRHFLRSRGLSDKTPVSSPTYTILNEYCIGNEWYAHLDLYRAESHFSLDEIGVEDRDYMGIFLEWPLAGGEQETIEPTHVLSIAYACEGSKRHYSFHKIDQSKN